MALMPSVPIKKRFGTQAHMQQGKIDVKMDREEIAFCKSVREASEGMAAAGSF